MQGPRESSNCLHGGKREGETEWPSPKFCPKLPHFSGSSCQAEEELCVTHFFKSSAKHSFTLCLSCTVVPTPLEIHQQFLKMAGGNCTAKKGSETRKHFKIGPCVYVLCSRALKSYNNAGFKDSVSIWMSLTKKKLTAPPRPQCIWIHRPTFCMV